MLRIDADAHVLETEKTWEYMEGLSGSLGPRLLVPSMVHRMTSIGWSTAHCGSNRAIVGKTRRWLRGAARC